jgi:hypothetical protein
MDKKKYIPIELQKVTTIITKLTTDPNEKVRKTIISERTHTQRVHNEKVRKRIEYYQDDGKYKTDVVFVNAIISEGHLVTSLVINRELT